MMHRSLLGGLTNKQEKNSQVKGLDSKAGKPGEPLLSLQYCVQYSIKPYFMN